MEDLHAGLGLDFLRGFALDMDLEAGAAAPVRRRLLSQMAGMFYDGAAYQRACAAGDPEVYAFHETGAPQTPGDLAFGYSLVRPGKVGDEYFMTKGHFHTILQTGEVYYCLKGHGYMLLENPEGDWRALELTPGRAAYVPPRYAHRSVNVDGQEPLLTFFVFRADAGHDYGTIETKGFRKLLVERDGRPAVIDNPNWK